MRRAAYLLIMVFLTTATTLSGCSLPSALPGEATPETLTSPTSEAACDVNGWRTYEDTEQRYRLCYPAGATIAPNQDWYTKSGYTRFILTDNQTTYRVEAGRRKAPVSVDRPALMIQETLHQGGKDIFNISEIQEFTINGVQVALVAYSSRGSEPCRIRRDQLAYFLVGEHLYSLVFEVIGPGQCDATAVPWFEQMLHSFEPY